MTTMRSETERGFEPPRNVQFSVFLPNRVGKLLELLEVFEGHALQVAALSVIDSADHAVVRIITSRSDLARRLLEKHGVSFSETDVLIVELGTQKTLADICKVILEVELNIHFAYPLLLSSRAKPAFAIYTDDQILAGQILRRKMFTLLGENDLGENATPGGL